MQSFKSTMALLIWLPSMISVSQGGLVSQPVQGEYTIPTQNRSRNCRLELSKELFGGVNQACGGGGGDLDRSRCCPVLAAWLFAAHARSALEAPAPSPSPAARGDMPMMPEESQECVESLHEALQGHNIRIPSPNSSCDAIWCFCGIRLHQIASLTCPASFNVSASSHNVTPSSAVKHLEINCLNPSYSGCTTCLSSLHKVRGYKKEERGRRKMLNRDCQLMGLTWLLARNKTAYIPTVSAVLRAIMYSAHPQPQPQPQESRCSPDEENMPLAVDSLQFDDRAHPSSSSPLSFCILSLMFLISLLP